MVSANQTGGSSYATTALRGGTYSGCTLSVYLGYLRVSESGLQERSLLKQSAAASMKQMQHVCEQVEGFKAPHTLNAAAAGLVKSGSGM